MVRDWQELTKLTGGSPLVIERVGLENTDTAIEGNFELPPLARLSEEDQVFIMVLVSSHGSIKEIERAPVSANLRSKTGSIASLTN